MANAVADAAQYALAIPELGHFALLLCLPIAALLALLPAIGVRLQLGQLMASAKQLALGLWICLVVAFACLAYAFAQDDFSLALVAQHSNTALPMRYKLSAVWGNHEGSLLLWGLILSCWTLAVAYSPQQLPLATRARVLAVLGGVALGFLMFIIFTSNPFTRDLLGPPLEGRDLNPLLQDIGLILHPPMLYIGYVGFAVAFAFAIAALLEGRLDAQWARWTRPWTAIAWAFLTVGIALGSWWAYYELGWGGWWFWDPVENASLMPWLAGTALLHSLIATERQGVFRSWTVLLAILAFSLSLLGTFLVRSGILVSVHAFAADPARGMFILAFLGVVTGGSLLLYALRAPALSSPNRIAFLSRETWLLINNCILALSLAVVLLGTLFPLLMNALQLGSYSVGPPYFNALFTPLMVLLLVFMGIAPWLNWKHNRIAPMILRRWFIVALCSALVGLACAGWMSARYQQAFSVPAAIGLALASWLALMSLADLGRRLARRGHGLQGLRELAHNYWAMLVAHLGIAVCAVGIVLTSVYSQQQELAMSPGQIASVAGYDFRLQQLRAERGPNYSATLGDFTIARNGVSRQQLTAEKRVYHAGKNVMTEAGIVAGLWRDLYVSLGEPLDDDRNQQRWAVRIYVKPFIRWIWLGALMMATGGLISAFDKRGRTRGVVSATDYAGSGQAT
ncbi:MAG: heme lyase CcmF/NrfE family subunit [Pseudomonadales bacterium]|nr:heme lyase CcmF/NrfE family subunit [Pseudomonadales bacterium]NNM12340.1 heme lyase CcmF/NrfE family subunit [Pseudomonadales bacterium]